MRGQWLVLALCFAGCTTEPNAVDDTPQPVVLGAPAPRATWFHEASHDLVVTQDSLVVTRGSWFSTNCVTYGSTSVQRILNGTVTMTWEPAKPVLTTMELRVAGAEGSLVVRGDSPLTLDLPEVTPHNVFDGILVMAQADEIGIDVMQDVTIDVAWWHKGVESPSASPGGCMFSGN